MNNDDPVVNPLENFCGKENFKAQNQISFWRRHCNYVQ